MNCTNCGTPLLDQSRFCATCGAPVAPVAPPVDTYDPSSLRAKLAIGALAAVAIMAVLEALAAFNESRLYERIANGGQITIAEANRSDNLRQLTSGFGFFAYVVAGIMFLLWFHRVYRNIDAVGGTRRYSTAQSVWAWFVPIMCLFRPKQAANDIAATAVGVSGTLVTVWWSLFLIESWLGWTGGRVLLGADTPSEHRSADFVDIGLLAVRVVAVLVAIEVVRRISAGQDAAHNGRLDPPPVDSPPAAYEPVVYS
jgi:hypothetical protein